MVQDPVITLGDSTVWGQLCQRSHLFAHLHWLPVYRACVLFLPAPASGDEVGEGQREVEGHRGGKNGC